VAFGGWFVAVVLALTRGRPLSTLFPYTTLFRSRAERSLALLADRAPRTANRRAGKSIEKVAVDEVRIGDELVVRAGELVPVDGVLLDAQASLDEAAVTGEPLPAQRRKGDALRSGTVNAG